MATVGEKGWPYVQYRGSKKGFLKMIDDTTVGYADFRRNGQYISTGNIETKQKTTLILIDYPQRQRLKFWAEATIDESDDRPELLEHLKVPAYKGRIERLFTLKIKAFDWNCPRHITPRYTVEEIHSLAMLD